MKTLEQWLALLEKRHPVEIELGLDRIGAVARRLGLFDRPIARNIVTVAGTNGKGSCVRTLETLALKQGLAVGAYTSPHLVHYNERIRLAGGNVDDARICRAFETIDSRRDDIPLTYFEVGTLAALLIFADAQPDLAILEVGLGGRYDAVNIVDADVAVITPIALDHMHWLGRDRETIAREKAGIARPGRPVIVADPSPPASLPDELKIAGGRCLFIGSDFGWGMRDGHLDLEITATGMERMQIRDLPVPSLPLPSVCAAVQAFQSLGFPVSRDVLADAVRSLELAGRYQRIVHRDRTVILDVAHNPAAAAYLAEKLRFEERPVHAVCAVMADKDAQGFVDALATAVDRWFVGDLRQVPRALKGGELGRVLGGTGLDHSVLPSIEDAFDNALRCGAGKNTLVVCGSFFTISAVMKHLEPGNAL